MLATSYENLGAVFQDDAEAVSFAAGLLDISEFRLFEIAYVHWFGSEPEKKTMEGSFGSYLQTGLAPFWLRDMTRMIILKYRKGNLMPSRLGIDQPGAGRFKRRLGWILVGVFYFLIFFIVWSSATFQSY